MKILNLYAGIGGNRLFWENCEVTAVEYNPDIANEYQRRFPNDTVIVADAHEYLINHVLDGWDFIWSSPPCPSHSRINTDGQRPPRYPEMSLYQEIIMLSNNWYKGKWVVENVIPYYEPLVKPSVMIDRHYFWCNYKVNAVTINKSVPIQNQSNKERFGISLEGINIPNKRQILRNLVNPEIGRYFLEMAFDMPKSQILNELF